MPIRVDIESVISTSANPVVSSTSITSRTIQKKSTTSSRRAFKTATLEIDKIGTWSKESVVSCINRREPVHLCTQSLKQVLTNFLPTKSLIVFGNMEIQNINEGVAKENEKIHRFEVTLGHKNAHLKAFELNRSSDDESFDDTITTFFSKLFNTEESQKVGMVMANEELVHCIVWCNYHHKASDGSYSVKSKIASAVTFRISVQKNAAIVLYLGSAQTKLLEYAPLRPSTKKRKTENYTLYGNKLGVLMISLVQKIQYYVHSNHDVVCQTNPDPNKGALPFYMRLWFKKLSSNDKTIRNIYDIHNDVSHRTSSLVWVGSRCSVYLVYPYWIEDTKDLTRLQTAIQIGKSHILQISDEEQKEMPCNESWLAVIQTVDKLIKDEGSSYQVQLEEEHISGLKENYLCANKEGLDLILQQKNADLITQNLFPKGEKKIDRNHNYKVMAQMLFGNDNRYDDIRCFINYILSAMQHMSIEIKEIFDDDTFRKDIINASLLLEQIYSEADFKTAKLLKSEDDAVNAAGPVELMNALYHVSKMQVCSKNNAYKGGILELKIIASCFDINLIDVQGISTKPSKNKNDNNEVRNDWKLFLDIERFQKYGFLIPAITKSKSNGTSIYISRAVEESEAYALILLKKSSAQKIDSSEDEDSIGASSLLAIVNEQRIVLPSDILTWLNYREGKLLELDVSPDHSGSEPGRCFTADEINQSFIDDKYKLQIVRVADPLEHWLTKKYILVDKYTEVDHLVKLRPESYTSSRILEACIKDVLQKQNNSVFVLLPSYEASWTHKENVRTKIRAQLEDRKTVCILKHINGNHWVVMVFKKPSQSNIKALTIFYADSLKADKFFNKKDVVGGKKKLQDELKQFILYFFFDHKAIGIDNDFPLDLNDFLNNEAVKQLDWNKLIQMKPANHVIGQPNTYDCGICCLMFIHQLILSTDIDKIQPFSSIGTEWSKSTTLYRLFLLHELIKNSEASWHEVLRRRYPFEKITLSTHPKASKTPIEQPSKANNDTDSSDGESINSHTVEPMVDEILHQPKLNEIQIGLPAGQVHQKAQKVRRHKTTDDDDDSINSETVEPMVEEIQSNLVDSKTELSVVQHQSKAHKVRRDIETDADNETINSETVEAMVSAITSESKKKKRPIKLHDNPTKSRKVRRRILSDEEDVDEDDKKPAAKFIPNTETTKPRVRIRIAPVRIGDVRSHGGKVPRVPPRVPTRYEREMEAYERIVEAGIQNLANMEAEYDRDDHSLPDADDINEIDLELSASLIANRMNTIKKKSLKPHWEIHAFEQHQQSAKDAKDAYDSLIADEIIKFKNDLQVCDTRLRRAMDASQRNTKPQDHQRLLNAVSDIRNEWIKLKAQMTVREYERECLPIFHPKDGIKAVQIRLTKNRKFPKEYYVLATAMDGTDIVKQIDPGYLQQILDKQYWDMLQEHSKEAGWVCHQDDGNIKWIKTTNQMKQLVKRLKPMYIYQPSQIGPQLHYIRVTFDETNADPAEKVTFWGRFIGCNDYFQEHRESLVTKIQNDETIRTFFNKAKFDYGTEIANKRRNPDRMHDKQDKEWRPAECGFAKYKQHYYLDVRTFNIRYVPTKYQISRIKWDIMQKRWYGIELEDRVPNIIKLQTTWVERTFPADVRQQFKEIALQGTKKFLAVPLGDFHPSNATMDISTNPVVQFRNKEPGICAFASTASVLNHFHHFEEASVIMNLSKVYEEGKIEFNRVLESIMVVMSTTYEFRKFRQQYSEAKLKKTDDILNLAMEKNDFAIITIYQTNNSTSHAIAVTQNYLVDSNASNMLPRTQEGLDGCCGTDSHYLSIFKGYIWRQRSDFAPFKKNKKNNRRKS